MNNAVLLTQNVDFLVTQFSSFICLNIHLTLFFNTLFIIGVDLVTFIWYCHGFLFNNTLLTHKKSRSVSYWKSLFIRCNCSSVAGSSAVIGSAKWHNKRSFSFSHLKRVLRLFKIFKLYYCRGIWGHYAAIDMNYIV